MQERDIVEYQGRQYGLAYARGGGLLDLHAYGIHPLPPGSFCWDGYICRYTVSDNSLVLSAVYIWRFSPEDDLTAREGKGPLLFGHAPELEYRELRSQYTGKLFKRYEGRFIYRPATIVPFTGRIWIGDGFMMELYLSTLYPAWMFREVHELAFDNGRLLAAHDRSETIRQSREERLKHPLKPPVGATYEELAKWVDDCFNLDFAP